MRIKWTKEKCEEEALKYNSRSDFQKKSGSAYRASVRYNILDNICSHMNNIGNRYKRCIYSYEFDDNHVYVGLTFNLNKRHRKHLEVGTVYDYIQFNKHYTFKQLTDYIDVNLAIQKENEFVEYYKNKNYIILNKVKTGSVGTLSKWNKEKCQIEALKYSTKFEFQKKSRSAYMFAFSNKYLNDICSHMESRIWTKEKCQIEALKYSTRIEYRKNSPGSYSAALKNGWKDEVCSHMKLISRKNFWTYDECKKEASKYTKRGHFAINSASAYKVSRKNNWLNDFYKK